MTEQTQTKAKFVTVACKLPMGMLLHLQQEYKDSEQTPNGVREVTRYRKVGDGITVFGPSMPVGVPTPPNKRIVGGYALTRGVPAEFWDKWLAQNKDAPYVKSEMIFALPNTSDAEDRADKQADVKSGLEPLDPTFTTDKQGNIVSADPRYPKPLGGVAAVHTGERVA